jgi:hypothetical protein
MNVAHVVRLIPRAEYAADRAAHQVPYFHTASTLLSRSARPQPMTAKGQEDQFRPRGLSGGYRLSEATFAGVGGKEEDAPKNEPARAGGEHASRSAQFRRGDAQ